MDALLVRIGRSTDSLSDDLEMALEGLGRRGNIKEELNVPFPIDALTSGRLDPVTAKSVKSSPFCVTLASGRTSELETETI